MDLLRLRWNVRCFCQHLKLMLLILLHHLTSSPGPSAAAFYPDCFDLSTDVQADEFRRHFRWNAASAILRIVAEDDFVYAPSAAVVSGVARDVLAALLEADPQERIAGNRNVWIIKPACMSRGRGIGCYNNIDDLLRHANIQTKMSSTANAAAGGLAASRRTELLALEDGPRRGSVADKWVVQRYIERPLIVHRRKFDLRQWVVVSSWNPLKVWFYDKCYVRFAAEDYDGETGDIGNIFAHLTNNCIARHSLDFAAKDVTGEGNM